MRIIPTQPKRNDEIITKSSRALCKHANKYTAGAANLWACRDCGKGLLAIECILCDGTGSKESRSGKTFHCRSCNGTGIRAFKLVTR